MKGLSSFRARVIRPTALAPMGKHDNPTLNPEAPPFSFWQLFSSTTNHVICAEVDIHGEFVNLSFSGTTDWLDVVDSDTSNPSTYQ